MGPWKAREEMWVSWCNDFEPSRGVKSYPFGFFLSFVQKWVCALKQIMAEVEIYGPADAGNPAPKTDPTLIQLVDSPPLMIQQRAESPHYHHHHQYQKQQEQHQQQPAEKALGVQSVELENRENVMRDDDDQEPGLPLSFIPLSPF